MYRQVPPVSLGGSPGRWLGGFSLCPGGRPPCKIPSEELFTISGGPPGGSGYARVLGCTVRYCTVLYCTGRATQVRYAHAYNLCFHLLHMQAGSSKYHLPMPVCHQRAYF